MNAVRDTAFHWAILERVWGDDRERGQLIDAGSKRDNSFSWEETARKTLAVYERLGSKS